MTKTVKKTYLVAAVYKGGEEKKSTENAMLVNRCFLSSFSTTCVSLEEERKQKKKKNVYRVFNRNFCSEKKLQEKKPHKEEKKERKNAKKVTKSDQMHSFPSRVSLSLSFSLHS